MELRSTDVAIVTGAGSGIGRALAAEFVRCGLRVVISDVEPGSLDETASVLKAGPDRILAVPADVSRLEDVERVAARALEVFGGFDIVCNNAGVQAGYAPLWEYEPADWIWTLNVNLWGVINGIRSFVPHLISKGRGHVVNTASAAAAATVPFNGPYSAAKSAVLALSEVLRLELDQVAPEVGVSALCPGVVLTRIRESARNRPASLAPKGERSEFSREVQRKVYSGAARADTEKLAPDDVARHALDAIRQNRLYVFSHRGWGPRVRARIEPMLASLAD